MPFKTSLMNAIPWMSLDSTWWIRFSAHLAQILFELEKNVQHNALPSWCSKAENRLRCPENRVDAGHGDRVTLRVRGDLALHLARVHAALGLSDEDHGQVEDGEDVDRQAPHGEDAGDRQGGHSRQDVERMPHRESDRVRPTFTDMARSLREAACLICRVPERSRSSREQC